MSRPQRLIADVPAEWQRDGIRTLVIEEDPSSRGWFFFLHERWPGPDKADYWHESREDAIHHAESVWGVSADSWREVADE
jgi:hypothetical protein